MKRSPLTILLVVVLLGMSITACRKGSYKDPDGSEYTIPLSKIYFDLDRYNLSSESRATLEQNAGWLKEDSSRKVSIEGHADERGTDEYNLALGERRAAAARDYLINLGISSDRIRTNSYGESQPVDSGHNESAWAKNRRDEINGKDKKR